MKKDVVTKNNVQRGVIWQNNRFRVVVMRLGDSWYPCYEELRENSMGDNGWVSINKAEGYGYSYNAAMEQFVEAVLNNGDKGEVHWKVIS